MLFRFGINLMKSLLFFSTVLLNLQRTDTKKDENSFHQLFIFTGLTRLRQRGILLKIRRNGKVEKCCDIDI